MVRKRSGSLGGEYRGAAEHKLAVTVHPYPLEAADQALRDLKAGRFDGAAVLTP